jgi:hypothetical protein
MTQPNEPLPIWFFVGLILLAYGLLVVISGLLYPNGSTVLAQLRPALWWGAIMLAAGGVFLLLGLRGRGSSSQDKS